MTGDVRIPTVAETVRAYLLRGLLGEPRSWRHPVVGLLFLGAVALIMPRWDSLESPPVLALVVTFAAVAASDAYREYQFGGPRRLIVAAGVTSVLASMAIIAVVYTVSVTFGREPGTAPIESFWRLPTEVLASVFLGFGVLIVILYFVRKPARLRAEAEDREKIRAERAARGAPVEA